MRYFHKIRNKLSVPLTVVTIFFRLMYNKTIIRFGFCDIQNNQGLGKGYLPQPSASADNPYLHLDYSGYHKTSSNNCLESKGEEKKLGNYKIKV